MSTGKWLGAALVAALVAAPVLVTAAPAEAAVLPAGVTTQSALTAFDSNSPKTIEAKCPAGQRVLGGGVRVNAGTHVLVTREEPISAASGDSYLVSAEEDAIGTTTTWALQAYAICSNPIPGLRLVAAVSPTRSDNFASVTAECPAGTNLLGAGGRILDGQGRIGLDTDVLGGAFNPHGATASGSEGLTNFPGNWSVIAFGVCATVSTFGDVQLVKNQTVSDPSTPKQVVATCPAGMTVTGGAGLANIPGAIASVNVDALRTRIQAIGTVNDTGAVGAWNLIAEAVCAR
jgi:hypothetical protein